MFSLARWRVSQSAFILTPGGVQYFPNATSKINSCITSYCRNRVYCWQEGGIWGELDYLWISPLWHRKVTFLLYLGPNIPTLQSQINKVVSNWRKHFCGFTNLKYTASIFCEHKSRWYNLLTEYDYSASQDLHLFLFAVRKLRRWLLFPSQDDLDFSLSSRYTSANKLFVTFVTFVHIAEKSPLESLLSF